MLRRLLAPRYLAFTALMVVVAVICVALGTWQIARFAQKRAENGRLRSNDHAAAAPVFTLLSPTTASDAGHRAGTNRFRTATATGTYDPADEVVVRGRSVNDTNAFLVVTPLRTPGAVLLVLRGWVPDTGQAQVDVSPAPSGTVTVRTRLETSESTGDEFGKDPANEVRSINADDASRRLGAATYDGFGQLLTDQPGTQGLRTMPAPDLSNPAGGAVEPQHLAYITQWYLFALLALAAPPVMARAEARRDADEPTDPETQTDPEQVRRAKLADRYGAARRI